MWGKFPEIVWKGFGDKETHPKYVGDVKNGEPNGLGVIIYTDGSKYVGRWRNGKRNGQGTFTFSDGRKYIGDYKDGFEWNGTDYDKNGNIYLKWVYGEWKYP